MNNYYNLDTIPIEVLVNAKYIYLFIVVVCAVSCHVFGTEYCISVW